MIPKRSLPLDGVRILDLTRVLAGPYCTMILGDLGAEILKVEQPGKGDDTRNWGPPFAEPLRETAQRESAYFLCVNRNKKSLTVNMKHKQGVEIIRELAQRSDVLIENFIPGKLEKMGLGYQELSSKNPGLIYTSISGYGPDGPYSKKPGYDVIIEGEAGLMSITGERDGPPVKVGVAITDLTTGLYAHGAIMAALLARHKTGLGQKIDLSLLECQVASLVNIGSSYLIGGEEGQRWGTAHASVVPYEAFKTKDGRIIIGAGSDLQFQKLCKLLGRSELSQSEKYRTNRDRVKHRDELVYELESILVKESTEIWLKKLETIDIPFGPVKSISETFQHPQVLHRKMVQEVNHPTVGPIRMTGFPVKYSESKLEVRNAPPTLGQHTEEILKEYLGYDKITIDKLRNDKVI